MLWTSDVVKDPWFPLVKDPSGSMSSYHLSRFTPRCNDPVGNGCLRRSNGPGAEARHQALDLALAEIASFDCVKFSMRVDAIGRIFRAI